jgi:hypothetical protein
MNVHEHFAISDEELMISPNVSATAPDLAIGSIKLPTSRVGRGEIQLSKRQISLVIPTIDRTTR